jgi:hypothetical protein
MKKYLVILFIFSLALVGIFFRRGPSLVSPFGAGIPSVANPALNAPFNSAPSKTPIAIASGSPDSEFSAESRRAVLECLGVEAPTWEQMDQALLGRANGPSHLEWRVASVEENGKETRLRLAPAPTESGQASLRLQLFSVDAEGLPDLQPVRPGQDQNPAVWFEDFLKAKNLLRRAEREEIPLTGNGTYERESENGVVTEAHALLDGKELACGRRSERPGCLCRQAESAAEE